MKTNQRGLYFNQDGKSIFVPALKISEVIKALNEYLILSAQELECLSEKLYSSVANYVIDNEFCWLSLDYDGKSYQLTWGISPVIKAPNLSREAIAAAYYVWKQACCTPEEACKVLNVCLNDLMDLSAQFDLIQDT